MRLSRPTREINVGWLIRRTEPHMDLVECFDRERNTCPIAPACGLKGVLGRASAAFLAVLDEYTIDQFLGARSELVSLLDLSLKSSPGVEGG
jgi:Rrf2 family nitric oxide-sensitive transcriptional repressor